MLSDRPALSFTLGDLPEREATLFKSFVRLIDHRTQQHWDWRDGAADLLVLQVGANPQGRDDIDGRPVLRVGREPGRAPGYLSLPFRAADMEECLNALGARLLAMRRPAAQAHASAVAEGALPATPGQTPVQLLRWPPPHLLKGAQHVRLATLMTGRPLSIPALSLRSGLPLDMCVAFLRQLDQAGLLRLVAEPPAVRRESRVPPPAAGLFARIRSRLGLMAGARA